MASPKPTTGGGSLNSTSRSSRTSAYSSERPPPPYSLGQVGAVHPRSNMTSRQRRTSGLVSLFFFPPQKPSNRPLRVPKRDLGALAKSHSRVSARKVASEFMRAPKSCEQITDLGDYNMFQWNRKVCRRA